jgi:hypothetical protein
MMSMNSESSATVSGGIRPSRENAFPWCARLDQYFLQFGIFSQVAPAVIGGHEQKAQIVHVAIELAQLQWLGIANRLVAPPPSRSVVRLARSHNPQHAGQKPFTPVRPGLAPVPPLSLHGVHRIEVGIAVDERAQLPACESQRVLVERSVGVAVNLDHDRLPRRLAAPLML